MIRNDSSGKTALSGAFVDQATLFGTLTKIHSLNLKLISVNRLTTRSEFVEIERG